MTLFNDLDEKFEVEKTEIVPADVKEFIPEDDTEKARETLHSLIDKGQDAIEGILTIAKTSDHPRAYEVVGQLIKTVSDVAKDLVDVKKKKHDMEKADNQTKIGVQNNMFVGSTHDLMKMLKNPQQIQEVESDD